MGVPLLHSLCDPKYNSKTSPPAALSHVPEYYKETVHGLRNPESPQKYNSQDHYKARSHTNTSLPAPVLCRTHPVSHKSSSAAPCPHQASLLISKILLQSSSDCSEETSIHPPTLNRKNALSRKNCSFFVKERPSLKALLKLPGPFSPQPHWCGKSHTHSKKAVPYLHPLCGTSSHCPAKPCPSYDNL